MYASERLPFIKSPETIWHPETEVIPAMSEFEQLCDDLLFMHTAHVFDGVEAMINGERRIIELSLRMDSLDSGYVHSLLIIDESQGVSKIMVTEYTPLDVALSSHTYSVVPDKGVKRRDTEQEASALDPNRVVPYSVVMFNRQVIALLRHITEHQTDIADTFKENLNDKLKPNESVLLEAQLGYNDIFVDKQELDSLRDLLFQAKPWLPANGYDETFTFTD